MAQPEHRPEQQLDLFTRYTVRVPIAVAMTGMTRTRIYELIKAGEVAIAKDGATTLIFVDSLKEAIDRRRCSRRSDLGA